MQKDIIISGIKPSGELHLGTYLGAIKPFVEYQNEYELNIFIADIHALTKPISPKNLRKYTDDLICAYLAAGLNSNKCKIFKQSDIPAHAQLSQILTCYLNVTDLTKMPQYKNYCETHLGEAVPAGMLDYVNWMNADILLYSPAITDDRRLKVICGKDQLPHIYLCQDVAERFNKIYGETFKIPEAIVAKQGAKILSLSDPTKKMSKSESDKGTIYLLDDIEVSKKKIIKAVTDSENCFRYDPSTKPGLSNLITIYSCLTNLTIEEVVDKFKNIENYGIFKKELIIVLENFLRQLQENINRIKKDKLFLEAVLKNGRETAEKIASKKIDAVYKLIGLR